MPQGLAQGEYVRPNTDLSFRFLVAHQHIGLRLSHLWYRVGTSEGEEFLKQLIGFRTSNTVSLWNRFMWISVLIAVILNYSVML